jgi:phage terminase large subunit GpA-like protein
MWLSAQGKPRELQDVVNSYMAETWEQRPSKSRPDEVGKRLSTDSPRGVVPEWGRFLTVTVDQQAAEGGYRLFVVMAHGENERAMVIDIGWTRTLAEMWEPHMRRHFQHLDGGNSIQPDIAAVDSGWDTKETYDFCNSHPGVWALKGSVGDIKGRAYRIGEVKEGENKGQFLFEVNTDFWETELQARLDNRRPGEPGALELCEGLGKDRFFLDQLCNMMISDKTDRRGNAVRLWVKRHTSQPNDYRDAVRYGLALGRAWVEENGGLPDRSSIKTAKPMIVNQGDKRPDGRAWV